MDEDISTSQFQLLHEIKLFSVEYVTTTKRQFQFLDGQGIYYTSPHQT